MCILYVCEVYADYTFTKLCTSYFGDSLIFTIKVKGVHECTCMWLYVFILNSIKILFSLKLHAFPNLWLVHFTVNTTLWLVLIYHFILCYHYAVIWWININNKVVLALKSNSYCCNTPGRLMLIFCRIFYDTCISSTSEVHATIILVLPMVRN
jgi:hypothetical protein